MFSENEPISAGGSEGDPMASVPSGFLFQGESGGPLVQRNVLRDFIAALVRVQNSVPRRLIGARQVGKEMSSRLSTLGRPHFKTDQLEARTS